MQNFSGPYISIFNMSINIQAHFRGGSKCSASFCGVMKVLPLKNKNRDKKMWPFMASFLPFRYMAQEYNTAQKIKFFTDDFFRKCDQIRRKLVTFTKEILYGKLNFLCTVRASTHIDERKTKDDIQYGTKRNLIVKILKVLIAKTQKRGSEKIS